MSTQFISDLENSEAYDQIMASGSTRKFESKVAQLQGIGTDEGSHDYSSLDVGELNAGSQCPPNNEEV